MLDFRAVVRSVSIVSTASPVFDSIARAVSWSEDRGGSPATVSCFSRLASVAKWLVEEVIYYSDKGTEVEVNQTKEQLTVSG